MKSWQIQRRAFLRGTGVAVALPWLEGMTWSAEGAKPPKRLSFSFFPYGVPMPKNGSEDHRKHGWFPVGQGSDYQLPGTHQHLEPLRQKMTFFGGLSHPLGRRVPGHKAGDVYLTGADISGSAYRQSISVDQVAANHVGQNTRIPSLILSANGGVNRAYRSFTLSYDRDGRPIPSESNPREIFRRLFGTEDAGSRKKQRNELKNHASILDAILAEANSLNRRLGKRDQAKMDEYLSSVRDVEKRVERAQDWLNVPKPQVDPDTISLDAGPDGPKDFIRALYDLTVLALQTDTTRVATYQIASEHGGDVAVNFPAAVGISKNAHAVSHDRTNYQQWSTYAQFLSEQYGYFLQRLDSVQEGNGTLLDNTMTMYGCCTSQTHVSRNYPLILAGGNNLGIDHGQYRVYSDDVPLSNLFVTLLDRMQVPARSFKDSSGDLSEIVRS